MKRQSRFTQKTSPLHPKITPKSSQFRPKMFDVGSKIDFSGFVGSIRYSLTIAWYVCMRPICLTGNETCQRDNRNIKHRKLKPHLKLWYWVFLFNHSGTIEGKRLILGPFWGRSEHWRAQSARKTYCESISDTPEASKWVKKMVPDRFWPMLDPRFSRIPALLIRNTKYLESR